MKKVLGCGIDIEELARFKNKIPASGTDISGFANLVFTPLEIACNLAISPRTTFPLGFSCKEAFFKAFGISWTNSSISWKDIELIFNDKNNLHDYSIKLEGYAKEMFTEKKSRSIESCLEFTDNYVIFQVILLS
jgi:phosphopantetheine--protein transferase-like protein